MTAEEIAQYLAERVWFVRYPEVPIPMIVLEDVENWLGPEAGRLKGRCTSCAKQKQCALHKELCRIARHTETAISVDICNDYDVKPSRRTVFIDHDAEIPSPKTLLVWMKTGAAQATDGCWVDVDGHCAHGCPSWLLELGLVEHLSRPDLPPGREGP